MLFISKTTQILCLLLVLLAACSQPPIVPLEDHSVVKTKKTVYVVGSGDTLYSIAFLSGLDYRELAQWNNIAEPYLIKRGDKISLLKPKGFKSQPRQSKSAEIVKTQPKPVATKQTVTSAAVNSRPQNSTATPKPPVVKFDNSWAWPIAASDVINFQKSAQNQGINIISNPGVQVTASAAGKVVYAGDSLKGYGNLIIIKHSEEYLSAYAHNRAITVKEGEYIRQGQKIAEVGSYDVDRAQLHFEIRKNGKPVSPLRLLPKKIG